MTDLFKCGVYIGVKPCGCAVAAVVDDPERRRETARTIGEWIMDGWTVRRTDSAAAIQPCSHED